jgi:hypothetical protein
MKCLHDGARAVRQRAAHALGLLMRLQPRLDPLVTELCTGATSADTAVRQAMVEALHGTLVTAGANIGEVARSKVGETLLQVR